MHASLLVLLEVMVRLALVRIEFQKRRMKLTQQRLHKTCTFSVKYCLFPLRTSPPICMKINMTILVKSIPLFCCFFKLLPLVSGVFMPFLAIIFAQKTY